MRISNKQIKELLYANILSVVHKSDESYPGHTLNRITDLINMLEENSARAGKKGDFMEFEIYVKEKTLEDGRKFNVFSAIERHLDGTKKYYDVKFTKEVTLLPSEHCIVVVDSWKDWNYDKKNEHPTIWIKAVKEIRSLEATI